MAADSEHTPHPMDVHVGRQMRFRRVQLGLSQSALAAKLGISFQAVQKYESGDIRVSASRLYDIAQVLEVPPGFFFEGATANGELERAIAEEVAVPGESVFDQREVLALIRGYCGIKDRDIRATLLRLIGKIGNQPINHA